MVGKRLARAVSPRQKVDLGGNRFGAPMRVKEATGAMVRSVKSVVGPVAKVRLFLLEDAEGKPVPVVTESSEGLRKVSATRSSVLADLKPARVDLDQASGRAVGVLPLASRGEALGLLEVIGPSRTINSSWKGLRAIADQSGLMLRMLQEVASLRTQTQSSGMLAELARDLVRARSSSKAVDDVARTLFETYEVPVLAWAVKADLTRLTFLSAYGLPPESKRVQTEMRSIRRLSAAGPKGKAQLLDSVAESADITRATAIDGGDAAIVVGTQSPEVTAAVAFIQPMLKDVLRRLAILAQADLRHERLDLGISWTAHELRGPLTGTRAVIDLLLQTADEESRTQHLLKRSREDLDRMAALVDGALRVTMADESLTRRPTPLKRVLQDAINICRAERSNTELLLRSDIDVVLEADAPHLTGAIANVLRNSMWHSPPASPVQIDVLDRGTSVQLRVIDQGPRVSGVDREMIFDPFGRGESPRAVGRGKGLGLFIARRVIEGHGGTIKVGSSASGAMFVIDLPVVEERRQASAS
jgi:K+-sensing histidine kinase KdpD